MTDKKLVQLVEDDKLLNDLYAQIITHEGYEVHSYFNGKEAIQGLRHNDYSMIMTDCQMPEMDGIEFIVRARSEGFDQPILFHSGDCCNKPPKYDNITYHLKDGSLQYITNWLKLHY